MNTAPLPQFFLLWKGRQSGPYSVAAIRDMLHSGEISRMHQINYNNRWMVLDEFLEKHGAGDPEAQRRREAGKREAQLKRHVERQLADEQARQGGEAERLAPAEDRSPLSHLLPPSAPPPPRDPSLPPPPPLPPQALHGTPFAFAPEIYLKSPLLAAIVGSGLLLFGVFTPVVSIPLVGGLTFLKLGWPAYIVIGLAVASLGLVFTARWRALWVTGGGGALVLLGCLGAFFRRLYDARDHPIQLQWGCFILGLGVLLIMAAAYSSSKSSSSPSPLSL